MYLTFTFKVAKSTGSRAQQTTCLNSSAVPMISDFFLLPWSSELLDFGSYTCILTSCCVVVSSQLKYFILNVSVNENLIKTQKILKVG